MSSKTTHTDSSTKLKNALPADVTVEEFFDALGEELDLVHRDDLTAAALPNSRRASGRSNTDADETDLDAYGTGIQESLPVHSPHGGKRAKRRYARGHAEREALNQIDRERSSGSTPLTELVAESSPDDHETGIQGHSTADETDRSELTGSAHTRHTPAEDDLDAYGTGVRNDTTAADYRNRERRIDVMAEALRRVDEDDE